MHTTGTPMITIVLDSKTMVPDAGRHPVSGGYAQSGRPWGQTRVCWPAGAAIGGGECSEASKEGSPPPIFRYNSDDGVIFVLLYYYYL